MDDLGPSAAYLASFPSTSSGPLRPSSPPPAPTDSPTSPPDALYALLNLSRTATEAEIRDRYRSLASTYHPDRQRTDQLRSTAHSQFLRIQRAYEVLIDPAKRTIYDSYGEEGLSTTWQVGHPNMTQNQLRAALASQYEAKKTLDMEALVKPKGDMSVVVDARAVFVPRTAFRYPERIGHSAWDRIQRVRTGQIVMKHSFEQAVDLDLGMGGRLDKALRGLGLKGEAKGQGGATEAMPKKKGQTQLVCQGQMAARGGAGGGNVVGTVRHQFSGSCWGEVGMSVLGPRILTARGTYSFDEHTYLTFNTVSPTLLAPPTIGLQLGRRIYPNTTGYIAYKSGFFTLGSWGRSLPPALHRPDRSALAVGLTNANPEGTGWTLETQAGVIANHITTDWSTRWLGLKWKIGAAVGTDSGINAFIDAESRLGSEGVGKMGCAVSCELGGGVTMRWRYSRLGQRVSVPILLSQDLNPYVVLGSTVLPFTLYAAAYHLVILPRRQKRSNNRARDLRAEHADHIAQTRAAAHEAIDLMARTVATQTAREREKNGLIVLEAHYGLASAFSDRGIRRTRVSSPVGGDEGGAHADGSGVDGTDGLDEEVVIDVTVAVQALVADSKMYIPGGRGKFTIIGFWDPCMGESKKLRVRYLFRGKVHQVTVDDGQSLRAPVKSHAVEQTE